MATKRKPTPKKTRFELFKRDNFTCVYCGNKPPQCVLEIDNIIPVTKGGSNEIDNLVTSCFDCNRGKSNNNLSNAPLLISGRIEIKKEKELRIERIFFTHFNEVLSAGVTPEKKVLHITSDGRIIECKKEVHGGSIHYRGYAMKKRFSQRQLNRKENIKINHFHEIKMPF